MKSRLLKKLRKKHKVVWRTVHVFKTLWSVTPLDRHRAGDPESAEFTTYSKKTAVEKQRQLILHAVKLRRKRTDKWATLCKQSRPDNWRKKSG